MRNDILIKRLENTVIKEISDLKKMFKKILTLIEDDNKEDQETKE